MNKSVRNTNYPITGIGATAYLNDDDEVCVRLTAHNIPELTARMREADIVGANDSALKYINMSHIISDVIESWVSGRYHK